MTQAVRSSVDKIAPRKTVLRRLAWKAPLILLLVSFAVWWEWGKTRKPDGAMETARSNAASPLAGSWSADVIYNSGERRRERFFFHPEGDKLFGTASFLGTKRGIEEGRIRDGRVSFTVRFEELVNDTPTARWQRYEGQFDGTGFSLKLFDDRGGAPVSLALVKDLSVESKSPTGTP